MSLSTYDIMAYCISVLEYDIQKAREQTEKTGKEINEISYILDFEHFSLQQCTYFCVVEIGLDLLRILQDYYPEIWKNILVVNAPFYFYQAFNLMRPILRHNLLQNIRVTSKEDTPGLLLKYVDPEVLPAFLGGKRVDSKGDPMCSEFVKYGGMVPEEYYACNRTYLRKKDLNTETILIAARSFYNYPVIVQKADSYIRIDLSVKSGSILTSLLYRPFDQDLERPNIPRTDERLDPHNEEHNIRLVSPPVRLQAHLVPISYNKFAAWPGIYIFKFDNTHSWLKSRRIDFNIRVESHCS
ncbi:SEC14-like protein 2, partial [Stegodyphus mimosarum]